MLARSLQSRNPNAKQEFCLFELILRPCDFGGKKRKTSVSLSSWKQSERSESISLATSFGLLLALQVNVDALLRTHVLSKHEAGTGI